MTSREITIMGIGVEIPDSEFFVWNDHSDVNCWCLNIAGLLPLREKDKKMVRLACDIAYCAHMREATRIKGNLFWSDRDKADAWARLREKAGER